jgi:homoserine O-acetyltransferase/O-succinyltransferase
VDGGSSARAVAIARGIALTTYRTAPEFAARFASGGRGAAETLASVDAYLAHNGGTFARRFDAAAFLCLSESLDLHEIDPATVRTPVTLVAVTSDTLVPPSQSRSLHARLGGRSTLVEIESIYGHDAFLKERAALSPILNTALRAGGSQ